MIHDLIQANILDHHEHGFIVVDGGTSSPMMLSKIGQKD